MENKAKSMYMKLDRLSMVFYKSTSTWENSINHKILLEFQALMHVYYKMIVPGTCIKFYNIISVEEYFGLQIECICTSCIIIQRILLILKLLNVIAKKLINHAPVAGKVRSAN